MGSGHSLLGHSLRSMDIQALPNLLYADRRGRIYDHPRLKMIGYSGTRPSIPGPEELVPMPEYSKLFFIPDCEPIGLDPDSGRLCVVDGIQSRRGVKEPCFAVASFPEPGFVRTLLPAVKYKAKDYVLPLWAYTAVGYREERYWISAFKVEDNPKWDPRNYDDRDLVPAMETFRKVHRGPLCEHLANCAAVNHCFAAKNLFLGRWEAPLPVSRRCNASCLGCLSLQGKGSCKASHRRISFKPSLEEIVSLSVQHLERAPEAMVSFGQGCEGEPLTEHSLIAESIKAIRGGTVRGTINLNTNGGLPDALKKVADSGLDSVRISVSSARPEFYYAYYRPRGYTFEHVVLSLKNAVKKGLYTMINYLVFPGITDQPSEVEALMELIRDTGVNFIHLKNLCIDPEVYLDAMPARDEPALGIMNVARILKEEFPSLELGYFNKPA